MFTSYPGGLFLQASLLWQTQCAVLDADGMAMLIDPGFFPHEIVAARDLARNIARGRPLVLVLSHSDFDHIVGAGSFGPVEIVASQRWDRSNERRARRQLERFDGEHYIVRDTALAPVVPTRTIAAPGEEFGGCRFFPLAGHTWDGRACFHPGSGALIVGDYLSDCEFPFIYVSARAYRETLAELRRLVAELGPALLVSQHGPVAQGPRAIEARLRASEDYLERLLAAGRAAASPRELARATLGAWRDGVPDYLLRYHRTNARIAWREAQL